jgi:hypothetical protein
MSNMQAAVEQIIEWVYGLTHVEHEIKTIEAIRTPESNDCVSFKIETKTVSLSGIKHPTKLVTDAISMTIGLVAIDSSGLMKNDLHEGAEVAMIPLDVWWSRLQNILLSETNVGMSIVSVTTNLYCNTERVASLPKQFLFRKSLLNSVR